MSSLVELVASSIRFGTIYADPPWQYENHGQRGMSSQSLDTLGEYLGLRIVAEKKSR